MKTLNFFQRERLLMNISAHLGAAGKFTVGTASDIYISIVTHTNDIDDFFTDQMLMDEVIAFNILD